MKSNYWISSTFFKGMTSNQVADKLFSNTKSWFFSYRSDRALKGICAAFNLSSNKHFITLLNTRFVDLFAGDDFVRGFCWDQGFYTVACLGQLFNDDVKSKLVDLFMVNNRRFSQSTRVKVLKFLVSGPFIPDKDPRLIKILECFGRSIKPDVLTALLSRIDGGVENPDVKHLLGKSKCFNYLKYDQAKVESNREEKLKLLRDIAQTQTVLKRIPFDVNIELEHIKELPPATRLDFLKFAFQEELEIFCRKYYRQYWGGSYNNIDVAELKRRVNMRKRRKRLDKLNVALIDPEQMKDLLFSVSLQKNEEISNWFSDYSKYYNILTGKEKIKFER